MSHWSNICIFNKLRAFSQRKSKIFLVMGLMPCCAGLLGSDALDVGVTDVLGSSCLCGVLTVGERSSWKGLTVNSVALGDISASMSSKECCEPGEFGSEASICVWSR